MNKKISRIGFSVSSTAVLAAFSISSFAASIIPGGSSWADSYSVDGKCYCATTYDHGIGDYTVETPAGTKTVREVCDAVGPGPGKGSNPVYNTVQCGHEPAHEEKGNFSYTDGVKRHVADEIECPGRVDIGSVGCSELGPVWDLSVFETSTSALPGRIEAENYSTQSGTRVQGTQDGGGGQSVGYIESDDYLSYAINVETSGTYDVAFRVASPRTYAMMSININGSSVENINIPSTGGWENWTTITHDVYLNAGEQTLRLDFSGGNGGLMNINWIDASLNETNTEVELENSNWSLSSSTNNNDVYSATDGNSNTRWTTYQQVQKNGQTFEIDFNETLSFDRIVLDSAKSSNDQPRGYTIHVSNDGSNWGASIVSGEGDANGLTKIDFADQTARFIRITQTGSATRNWWSIHELSVFSNSND